MALTEEQKERIRINRERALEIQRKRREEKEQEEQQEQKKENDNSINEGLLRKREGGGDDNDIRNNNNKRMRGADGMAAVGETKDDNNDNNNNNNNNNDDDDNDDLEAFEEGASDLASKTEAKKMYCLPEGSLAVCKFVEKENPRHKGWSKMKLYYRSELRRRARKRYGGRQGLIDERQRREEERFRNDIQKTKNIFNNKNKKKK